MPPRKDPSKESSSVPFMTKLKIIRLLNRKKSAAEIATTLKVAVSTVKSLAKEKDKILKLQELRVKLNRWITRPLKGDRKRTWEELQSRASEHAKFLKIKSFNSSSNQAWLRELAIEKRIVVEETQAGRATNASTEDPQPSTSAAARAAIAASAGGSASTASSSAEARSAAGGSASSSSSSAPTAGQGPGAFVTKRTKKGELRYDYAKSHGIERLLERVVKPNGDVYYLVKYKNLSDDYNDLEKDEGNFEAHLVPEFEENVRKIIAAIKIFNDYVNDRADGKEIPQWISGIHKRWEVERVMSLTQVGEELCYVVKFKDREEFEVVPGELLKKTFPHAALEFHESRVKVDDDDDFEDDDEDEEDESQEGEGHGVDGDAEEGEDDEDENDSESDDDEEGDLVRVKHEFQDESKNINLENVKRELRDVEESSLQRVKRELSDSDDDVQELSLPQVKREFKD